MKNARPVGCGVRWALGAAALSRSLALALAVAVAAGAAVSTPPVDPDLDPLAVTPEMRTWVERVLGSGPLGSAEGGEAPAFLQKLRRLREALTRPGAGGIVEIADPTPTARQAFASRRADCLGFAMLFVALARERGVAARFALAAAITRVDHAAGLRVERGHFAALYGDRVFDRDGERPFDPARDLALGDRAAVASFLSNRGAQALLAGEAGAAVDLFYRAVRFDPSIAFVWSNLGVALGRTGDAEGAVMAEEMALRLDPAQAAARRNLDAARRGGAASPRRR